MHLFHRIGNYLRTESAPAIASRGMTFYLRADYLKARRLLDRAFRYRPGLRKDTLLQAYWELAQLKTGEPEGSLEDLAGLQERLAAHPLAGGDLVSQATADIEKALLDRTTT